MKTALLEGGAEGTVEIGVVIAGDATVRGLNRTYRAKDRTTDVLSFASKGEEDGDHFVTPSRKTVWLGEVIISLPQAERQAVEQGHSLPRELAILITHGVLHLLGYDHEEPEGEKIMRALEKRALHALRE